MKIGFIGTGAMGQGMAANLLNAGHELRLFNRTLERAAALVAKGAELVDSPAAVCEERELVISMLADDAATETVVFGDRGVLEALPRGAVHCGCATISVDLANRLTSAHRDHAGDYVSAPVFGRPPAAAAAELFIVAAGASEALAICDAAFAVMGQRTFIVGADPVSANIVKISGNFMLASLIETLGEAFALTRKHGIDPQKFLEVMTESIFSAPAYKSYGSIIANGSYEPPGFKLHLGLKDIRLALAAADPELVPMPIASLVRDRFIAAIARGYQDLDWAALGRACADEAGLP